MEIVFDERCLEYSEPGHPESPKRVKIVYELLKRNGLKFVKPRPANKEDLLKVHTEKLVKRVKLGDYSDPDTPVLGNMYEYAKLAVGGAITAMELALMGKRSLSLLRPPGHHAGKDFLGGFCYFNNIAVAVARSFEKVGRVAIIDFDVHHGNGTQDIFLGDNKVMYFSIHQSPLYPMTGLKIEKNCFNFPMPPGTGEEEFMRNMVYIMDKVKTFNPDLIAVSAGFDAYRKEMIASFKLDIDSYFRIAKLIASTGKPIFTVLEGGYTDDMALCVGKYIEGMESK